jgi:hypothetical protein
MAFVQGLTGGDGDRVGGEAPRLCGEQLGEAAPRPPRPRPRREVRAAEEGLTRGRQPHAHRPAAAAGQPLHEGHVHGVDVGALFAIDLDAHVRIVQLAGDRFVFEALFLHHVAPVAGRVPDRQKHRPPERSSPRKGLVAPGEPIDRVVRVLQKVRARLEREPVRVLRRAVGSLVARTRHVRRAPGGDRGLQTIAERSVD